jgi:hypothetical protein
VPKVLFLAAAIVLSAGIHLKIVQFSSRMPTAFAIHLNEDFHDSRDDLRRPGFQRRQRQEPKGRRPDTLRSAETARRTAERLALAKAGVVAFSTAGDAELGDYDDEPTIIFKTGQLPAHFEDT